MPVMYPEAGLLWKGHLRGTAAKAAFGKPTLLFLQPFVCEFPKPLQLRLFKEVGYYLLLLPSPNATLKWAQGPEAPVLSLLGFGFLSHQPSPTRTRGNRNQFSPAESRRQLHCWGRQTGVLVWCWNLWAHCSDDPGHRAVSRPGVLVTQQKAFCGHHARKVEW